MFVFLARAMQRQLAYSAWGGKRHHSKPMVDVGLLYNAFSKNKTLLQNMGAYEMISRTASPDPAGMVALLPLIDKLVELSSCAEVHSSSIRAALTQMIVQKPEVNASKYNGNVWVNLRAERIGTLLCHVRALAREEDQLRKAALVLAPQCFKDLKGIIGQVAINPSCDASQQPKVVDMDDARTQFYPEVEASEPSRELKAHVSDSAMSVDSEGYPSILKSPTKPTDLQKDLQVAEQTVAEPSFLRRRLGTKATSSASTAWSKTEASIDLRVALGYKEAPQEQKPSTKALPKARSAAPKPKSGSTSLPKAKSGSAALPKAAAKVSKLGKSFGKTGETPTKCPWAVLKRTNAKNPERSYITGSYSTDTKVSLIVEVTRKWSSCYHDITSKILKSLSEDSITKVEALEMRQRLCEQYP